MKLRFPRVASLAILAMLLLAPIVSASEPGDDGFWGTLFQHLITFKSGPLLDHLGKPQFAIPAFIAINLIVFVETGLLIGFFLPGDSLLVMVGLIASRQECNWNLPLLLTTVSLSAIVGDTVGYSIGYKAGPKIFNREKSFFFKKEHLIHAQNFYVKHGGKTIILARFVPILRTFAPVVAGVGRMQYSRFVAFNVFGGIGWVCSMILVGYFLPNLLNPPLREFLENPNFKIEDHVEKVVVVVVFLSILPGIAMWLKNKLTGKGEEPGEAILAGNGERRA